MRRSWSETGVHKSCATGHPSNLNLLYAFFWVIPRCLNFICRRFRTHCLFHLHRQVDACRMTVKTEQCVPKRPHIKFRCWGITRKKAYNIQDTAKVWNQELKFGMVGPQYGTSRLSPFWCLEFWTGSWILENMRTFGLKYPLHSIYI